MCFGGVATLSNTATVELLNARTLNADHGDVTVKAPERTREGLLAAVFT